MVFYLVQDWLCEDSPGILEQSWKNVTDGIPHATECAQHLHFSWTPTLFLLLFSCVPLYDLKRSNNPHTRTSSPITYRIGLCAILFLDLTISLLYNFFISNGNTAIYLAGDLVQYVGICLALVLMVACRNRGVITSGVLFIYWFLLVVCGFPEFRYVVDGLINSNPTIDHTRSILYLIFYPNVCLQLFLSCFADSPSKPFATAKEECPELHTSFLNQITFWWFNGLALQGYRNPLERKDLWNLHERDCSSKVSHEFDNHFLPRTKQYQQTAKDFKDKPVPPKYYPSVILPLFSTFKMSLIGGAFLKLMFDLLQFVSPELLRQLINYMQDPTTPVWVGVAIAIIMFIVSLVQSLILHQYFHVMFRVGMNVRSILTSAIFRKALRLSNRARKNRNVGEIVNLMSVDAQRFQDMTAFVMLFWSAPLQIILSIFFLYRLLGGAVFAGVLFLAALIPFNYFISVKMRDCQTEQMKFKDERLKMMNEMLNGIKVLKLYAWEKSMQRMALHIRERELSILKKLAFLNAATTLSWACAPFLVAVLTFGVYVTIDPTENVLTPQVTFVALALFNVLRFPLAAFSVVFSLAIQCNVGNQRLKAFFAAEEMDMEAISHRQTGESVVVIKDGNFSWDSSQELILKDINIDVKKGSLVAVVGRVGSGKSSLLQALLGEMNKNGGNVNVNGKIAYVPQQPWIQNMTLKDNVLFDKKYDMALYDRVIEACALMQDIESLPAGDCTEIGEKGINLSGGQKQRVSLARAAYSGNDLFLLDDPLSAVDSHVGKHIFENVISSSTGLLKDTTRILVTHGLHYLKYCDHIIVFKEGSVSETGTYQELLARQGAFSELIEEFLVEEARNRGRSVSFGEDSEDVTEILKEIEPGRRQRIESQMSTEINKEKEAEAANGEVKNEMLLRDEEKTALIPNAQEKKTAPRGKLMEKENVETGKVAFSVYWAYIRSIGLPISFLFIGVYIFSSILGVGSNLWLARWSDDAKRIQESNGTETRERLLIYTGLGLGQALTVCSASVIMALGMVRASRILHEGMLKNILQSPMSFFDTTPLGRILNRFGKDVDAVDTTVPNSVRSMIATIFGVLATLTVIIYATPMVAVPFGFVAAGYLFIVRFYVSTSRQLKRLESASKSPIYSHFQESIQGASSIRAYDCLERFQEESQRRVDENMATYYPSLVANRWLAVRLELVGNLIVLCAALFAALWRDSPGLTAGLVGLSVSYALNITQTLNWAVRMTSELETNIVAVERIIEYSETPTEGSKTTVAVTPDWPEHGDVKFKSFSFRYRPGLDLVLRNVTAHINPCEKVGIVGRTGAGKSSLTLALFRIVEGDGGVIEIDGQNIAALALDDLRSRLTIVPQDPVLFSGTLRMNLDPFNAFNDEAIWQALHNSHLDSFVSSLPEKLSHQITEGGENLSVGQRQLLCLARALLRKTRVLILDEAAASVDVETDALLQRTIREQFKTCTVLTIAHRLNTVMDSDRLLVLDRGEVVEFDTPQRLLLNPNGIFYSMARDGGIATK